MIPIRKIPNASEQLLSPFSPLGQLGWFLIGAIVGFIFFFRLAAFETALVGGMITGTLVLGIRELIKGAIQRGVVASAPPPPAAAPELAPAPEPAPEPEKPKYTIDKGYDARTYENVDMIVKRMMRERNSPAGRAEAAAEQAAEAAERNARVTAEHLELARQQKKETDAALGLLGAVAGWKLADKMFDNDKK